MRSVLGNGSLRRRLVWAVLAATGIVFVVLGFAIQSAIERSSSLEFDERLAQQGRVILAYAEHEYLETGRVVPEQAPSPDEKHPRDVVYQVWTHDGTPVHRSVGAPLDPLVDLSSSGFSDVRIGETDWRVYGLHAVDEPLLVQMAELRSHRNLIAARVRAAVRTPTLAALPLLALLVWWLTTTALSPVDRLAREIRDRTTGDIEPLDMSQVPEEITALGLALNALIIRQVDALIREQRFTADAAHELRTPLAAVRSQAQVALRSQIPAEREHALRQLIAGVDRSTRLVTQLLSLARLEPAMASNGTAARNVSRVLHDVLHDLELDTERHNVRIYVIGTPPDTPVAEEPVYLLLRNILDNAIRHSPGGGAVSIEMSERDGRFHIAVTDQGPGIPPEYRAAVFDRFRRLSDSYAGSGLGLSIVKRVVDLLGGEIELGDANPPPGLTVTIELPSAGP
jgi:two-component system sensor histidine kinase QseC